MTGILDFLAEPVARLLAYLYEVPVLGGSYGRATIMLTLVVMVVLMPLTLRATKSTIKMTEVQPQLRKLQTKHKDDKQALNAEMMKLYQENGVNPVGGCLPMLLQLPVFLVLFNVLRGLTRRVSEKPYFEVANQVHELVKAPTTPSDTFDPKYLPKDADLYRDLDDATTMEFGPFDLSLQASEVFGSSIIDVIPYVILILFVVATSYYQQRQISRRRGPAPKNPTPQEKNMQMMTRVIPLFSLVTGFIFPAALVLYWATSNLFRIGQQSYITRSLYRGDGLGAKVEAARAAGEVDGDDDVDDDADNSSPELIGSGKPGGAKNARSKASSNNGGNKKNGSSDSGSGSKVASDSEARTNGDLDRDAAWAQRRAQRQKTQARKKSSSVEGSTRVTPKGTKPSEPKKKRKK